MNETRQLEAIAAMLRDVFRSEKFREIGYLNWLYRENPDGREISTSRFDGDACVAHYVVVPVQYRSANHHAPTKMALSLNTAVSPRARMRGLFVKLAEETFQRAKDAGVAAIVGVSNANSTHGLTERMGFRLVMPLPVKVGVSSMWSRGFATFRPHDLSDFELLSRIEPYLLGSQPSDGWASHWTPEKLLWRLRAPTSRYLVHASPDVLGISTTDDRFGFPIAVILKTFVRTPVPASGLLGSVCRAHRTPFYLHSGFASGIDIRGLPLPMSLRPRPLNFIYRQLLPSAPANEDFRLVNFEFLDFDAY